MSEEKIKLFIRTDAGQHIGLGHFMRCFALAQAWQDRGGRVAFGMAEVDPTSNECLSSESIELKKIIAQPGADDDDAYQTVALAKEMGAAWIVVDGYNFGIKYQKKLKESGFKLLIIDDYGHLDRYYADLILNQNLGASKGLYRNSTTDSRLLLGTQYSLIRREFMRLRPIKREIPTVARNLLITLGGSDPDNVTAKIVRALNLVEIDDLKVTVVVSRKNAWLSDLKNSVDSLRENIRIDMSANMPKLMSRAELAITASGSTCWELALMKVPMITLILAENQRLNGENLGDKSMAQNLGWHFDLIEKDIANAIMDLSTNIEMRRMYIDAESQRIDGQGALRVIAAILSSGIIQLRKVGIEDRRLIWEWANDQDVRSASFHTAPILWDEHIKWFKHKLEDPKCLYFIGLDENRHPIGQVRFDIHSDGGAEIHISIAKEHRGLGYGALLVQAAVNEIFHSSSVDYIYASIKTDNTSSRATFGKAGFKIRETQVKKGKSIVQYIRVMNPSEQEGNNKGN